MEEHIILKKIQAFLSSPNDTYDEMLINRERINEQLDILMALRQPPAKSSPAPLVSPSSTSFPPSAPSTATTLPSSTVAITTATRIVSSTPSFQSPPSTASLPSTVTTTKSAASCLSAGTASDDTFLFSSTANNTTNSRNMEQHDSNKAYLSPEDAATPPPSAAAAADQHVTAMPAESKPYISPSAALGSSPKNMVDTVRDARDKFAKKTEGLAVNRWQHLTTRPSVVAAMERIIQEIKVPTECGYEKIFHQTFQTHPAEQVKKSITCSNLSRPNSVVTEEWNHTCFAIKPVLMSFVLEETSIKSYLCNIRDIIWHVNFSDEMTAALILADDAVFIIDEAIKRHTKIILQSKVFDRGRNNFGKCSFLYIDFRI